MWTSLKTGSRKTDTLETVSKEWIWVRRVGIVIEIVRVLNDERKLSFSNSCLRSGERSWTLTPFAVTLAAHQGGLGSWLLALGRRVKSFAR